jgi:hypothetical protein
MIKVCFWVAIFFFVAAVCCGADAIKLEKHFSPAWCVVITWTILLMGVMFFSIVLVKG